MRRTHSMLSDLLTVFMPALLPLLWSFINKSLQYSQIQTNLSTPDMLDELCNASVWRYFPLAQTKPLLLLSMKLSHPIWVYTTNAQKLLLRMILTLLQHSQITWMHHLLKSHSVKCDFFFLLDVLFFLFLKDSWTVSHHHLIKNKTKLSKSWNSDIQLSFKRNK